MSKELYDKVGYLSTESRVVVGEFYELESGILPGQPHQLDREIIIKRGAKVLGNIVGGLVFLGQGVEVMGSVICENIQVDLDVKIWGGIYSSGQVIVGQDREVKKDIIGEMVEIGSRASIGGHVYGENMVTIKSDSTVQGIVYSEGDVNIGDYCKLDDLLANYDIKIGDHVSIEDSTIWSVEGTIEYGENVVIGAHAEGGGSLLKDGLRAFRRQGVEFNQSFPDAYHYVHSIDSKLNNITADKYTEILEQIDGLPEIKLPEPDNTWYKRSLTESIDYTKLEEKIKNTWYGTNFGSLITDLDNFVRRVENDVKKRVKDNLNDNPPAEDDNEDTREDQ